MGECTRSDFEFHAKRLCACFHRLHSSPAISSADFQLHHWNLKTTKEDGIIYLDHPAVFLKVPTGLLEVGRNEDDTAAMLADPSILEDPDQITENIAANHAASVKFLFSVVYSETYRVPVLYFQAEESSGSPCPRSLVIKMLQPVMGPEERINDSWDFISQEQHPITGYPSYFLHPCRTAERLKLLEDPQNKAYLWSWMSLMLPAVSFAIPAKVFTLVQRELSKEEVSIVHE